LNKSTKTYSFIKTYVNLTEILTDHKLASLGDAYINLAYSLAVSSKKGEPIGAKVKGTMLAEALKKAGLREHMPSRMTSHRLADAAEALIVYAWLHNHITLKESVAILEKTKDPANGFSELLLTIKRKLKFS